ncbi:phage protein [Streptococcus pyogenes]|nr:phage protein [Streptococcus pyogenes]VHD22719.1 phage protein [Streptococcus pyogenes]
MDWRHMTTTKKHVVRVYNKGITATYAIYDKKLFKEHEFATKNEAMRFIRQLELDSGKRVNEYYMKG